MIRTRNFPDQNYRAIFTPSGKTLHFKYDGSQPYRELPYPEILDVAINNKCFGSCVNYCYVAAKSSGVNYQNIIDKALMYWGQMDDNQRPFQVAIGGAGEPTLHPDFPDFLWILRQLGIMPNYTTNGMHLGDAVMEATVNHAGGVAVTCHKHLGKVWRNAVYKLVSQGVRVNLHLIPMSVEDVNDFMSIYSEFSGIVEYFVLLPYQPIGFGKQIDMEPVYAYLFDVVLRRIFDEDLRKQVAYGAYFYDELKSRPWVKADLYEHGVFSKYLDMQGDMKLYRSSFDWEGEPLVDGVL